MCGVLCFRCLRSNVQSNQPCLALRFVGNNVQSNHPCLAQRRLELCIGCLIGGEKQHDLRAKLHAISLVWPCVPGLPDVTWGEKVGWQDINDSAKQHLRENPPPGTEDELTPFSKVLLEILEHEAVDHLEELCSPIDDSYRPKVLDQQSVEMAAMMADLGFKGNVITDESEGEAKAAVSRKLVMETMEALRRDLAEVCGPGKGRYARAMQQQLCRTYLHKITRALSHHIPAGDCSVGESIAVLEFLGKLQKEPLGRLLEDRPIKIKMTASIAELTSQYTNNYIESLKERLIEVVTRILELETVGRISSSSSSSSRSSSSSYSSSFTINRARFSTSGPLDLFGNLDSLYNVKQLPNTSMLQLAKFFSAALDFFHSSLSRFVKGISMTKQYVELRDKEGEVDTTAVEQVLLNGHTTSHVFLLEQASNSGEYRKQCEVTKNPSNFPLLQFPGCLFIFFLPTLTRSFRLHVLTRSRWTWMWRV